MIFVTCGSSNVPFNRMMEALRLLPADELCVQHGTARRPPCAEAHPYLPFDEIVARMETANVVICHAGVGSIICAVRAGHVPIVFPRLKRYGEVVDDHQVELAQALASRKSAVLACTAEEIADAAAAPRRGISDSAQASRLAQAVRGAVRGRTAGPGADEWIDDRRGTQRRAMPNPPSPGADVRSA